MKFFNYKPRDELDEFSIVKALKVNDTTTHGMRGKGGKLF